MALDAPRISARDKPILAGLYLSKYDKLGFKKLGFKSFTEAYNVLGYATGSQPASIKNYRDEFDPLFPNGRKGWRKRPTREYCLRVFERYEGLDLESFSGLIQSFLGYDENAWSEIREQGEQQEGESSFAKRLITGLAAEKYFMHVQPSLIEFGDYALEDTTRFGCGYDFRLRKGTHKAFLAVEVKGLAERAGSVALTPKEHATAAALKGRFFLFVVKNFRESPFHEIYQDPPSGNLEFTKSERPIVHVPGWLMSRARICMPRAGPRVHNQEG